MRSRSLNYDDRNVLYFLFMGVEFPFSASVSVQIELDMNACSNAIVDHSLVPQFSVKCSCYRVCLYNSIQCSVV